MRLYPSPADFINERPFEVYIPAFYDPSMPEEYLKPKPFVREPINPWKPVSTRQLQLSPVPSLLDPNQLQRSALTVNQLLVMHMRKIEHQLMFDYDVVEILDGIDRYLLSIRPEIVSGVESVLRYARSLISWREKVYFHYFRYMTTHKAARDELHPNNDSEKSLFTVLHALGVGEALDMQIDPIRQREKPPYDIDALAPKPKKEEPVDMFADKGALGIANEGGDFDIDAFINKRVGH